MKGLTALLLVATIGFVFSGADEGKQYDVGLSESFGLTEIDDAGQNAPWGKAIGDQNGDGRMDVTVDGRQPRKLTCRQRVVCKLGSRSYNDSRGEQVWNYSVEKRLLTIHR